MAKQEIEFTVQEIVRLTSILNNVPWTNRGVGKLVDGLATAIELRPQEKETIGWQEAQQGNQTFYTWTNADAVFKRKLTAAQLRGLLAYTENPPQEIVWRRREKELFNSLMAKLGGDTLEEDESEEDDDEE